MPQGLYRIYGAHHLHFITCSCYRRQPELGWAWRRDLFLQLLEEARCKYRFVVHGYVVMPEHFHLLMNEPQVGDPSVVMKVVKERFSRQVHQRCVAAAQMWLWGTATGLAKAILRLQRVDRAQASGEATLHASQSGEAWVGDRTRAVAVESFGDGHSRPLIRNVRE